MYCVAPRVALKAGVILPIALLCSAIGLAAGTPAQTHATANAGPGHSPLTCNPDWEAGVAPPIGNTHSRLVAVSGVADNDIWAIGYVGTPNYRVSEHWDGSAWTVVNIPTTGAHDTQYYSVAAVSHTDVWAVGYESDPTNGTQARILHGDGTGWTIVPNLGNGVLTGVAAISANDVWAVGWWNQALLALHWDGTSWTATAPATGGTGNGSYFQAVAGSGPNDVWAVGRYNNRQSMIQHWDGTAWTAVPHPEPPANGGDIIVENVTARAADDAWMIGRYQTPTSFNTFTEHWDGTAWSVVPSPSGTLDINDLMGIVALGPNDVWAAGFSETGTAYGTILIHWDGQSWTAIPSHTGGLWGGPVRTGNYLWAVGSYRNAANYDQPMTMRYDLSCAPTATPTATATATTTATASATASATATQTATATPTPPAPPSGTPTAVPTGCPVVFSDVPAEDWAYGYIRWAYCRGIISGYADGTFRPANPTSRGQVAKMITLAAGWPLTLPAGAPHFGDVPPGSTFYTYIEVAQAHGILGGYADGTFRPADSVTRAQLTKLLILARGYPLRTPPTPTFSDVPASDWAYSYIETAVANNIIGGYDDGTFRPSNNATRAQFSKMIFQSFAFGLR